MAAQIVTITPVSLTAGTSVALSSSQIFCSSVLLEAGQSNTSGIYFGTSGVTTTNGHSLLAKEKLTISFDSVFGVNGKIDLSTIRFASDANSNVVKATYQLWQGS